MDLEKAYALISSKLTNWFESFIRLLPNLAMAALVMVIGVFIAKFVRNFALKMVRKVSHLETINRLFASFMYILVIGVTLFTALDILNLDKAVTTALAGAGILGLALAFAFQDIAANFMSGIFMSFRHPFNVGDLVKLGNYKGRIEAINLRDTALISLEGQKIIIPNKEVFQNPIENYSSTGIRRLDLKGRVSLTEDLEKVRTMTLNAVETLSERDTKKEVEFFYDEFAESSITFDLRIWMQDPEQKKYLSARNNAIMSIKKAFDEANIIIPFPVRTLDFGNKSNENLLDVIKPEKPNE
ncbi:mechanosensitive ion channel family protein [Pedobacter arcticus]|uniref:mechanosensitive ion channel family protein n=1 Tax=Pedobacter arcticus TaxID=752140 RepID=UPI0002D88064|nr:mechanosensitive ion channel family protein [Pedobacter arcticus]